VSQQPRSRSINPFRLFTQIDVLLVLFYNAVVYSVFYAMTASLSILVAQQYPFLTEAEIGLCFLPIGLGTIIGSVATGKILDREYKRAQAMQEWRVQALESPVVATGPDSSSDYFPLEKARLRLTPLYVIVFVSCTVAYGWCMETRVSLAAPLILTFFVGCACIAVMNTHQNLIMDLFPSQGAGVTAANNLVRCTMGAIFVSVIDIILRTLRPGWTFVLLGAICVLAYPASWYEMRHGMQWRAKRRLRDAQ